MSIAAPPVALPARPARHFPRFVVPLAALGLLAAFVVWRYEQTASEGRSDLVLQGNVDVRQVGLSFKVGGRIEKLLVDEGDAVKAGQAVAQLDVRYFQDDLRLANAQREEAAANYERAKNGPRPEEIEQARAQERERVATRQRAEEDFRRAEALFASRTIARQEYDQARAALDEAAARLNSATAYRRLVEAGTRVEDVEAARAQLSAAAAQVTAAERRLADSTLYAPNAGVILTRAREEGAIVNSGEAVFTLTLTSPVWIRTYVDEPDLDRIQPGMPATIATDAPFGRTYTGKVGYISPTAEFTPKNVETQALRTALVYRVRIVVDDPDGGLRQGMPATTTLQSSAPRPRSFRQRLFEALWLDSVGLGVKER